MPKPQPSGLSFLKEIAKRQQQAAKKPLSATAVKKATKIMEATGKTVTAISVHPNGTFSLSVASVAESASAVSANPWDEVLK